MSAESVTRAGRAAAEARMVDAITFRRVQSVVPNPDTGQDIVTYQSSPIYAGKCRVQTYEPQEYRPDAAGHTFTVQRYAVHIPVGTQCPRIGDVGTMGVAQLDPNLTGRLFRVVALLHKTNATAYRLGVEEVSA